MKRRKRIPRAGCMACGAAVDNCRHYYRANIEFDPATGRKLKRIAKEFGFDGDRWLTDRGFGSAGCWFISRWPA